MTRRARLSRTCLRRGRDRQARRECGALTARNREVTGGKTRQSPSSGRTVRCDGRGRLYELPSGIPVLEVPEADVLAHGTADPLADVATQARLAAEFAARAAHPEPGENRAPGGRWAPAYGELLTFDDPEARLPAIDRLEGFLPGGPSLYRRVLVLAIIHGGAVSAWLYASGRPPDRHARPLPGSTWR